MQSLVRGSTLWLLIAVTASLAGCRQRAGPSPDVPDQHAQAFDSSVLDALLTDAPQTIVPLDEVPVDVWIPDMELGHPRDSLILGSTFMFVVAQDSLYFGNYAHAIYAADLDGVLQRQIGRPGRAPGEFEQLSDLGFNGTYFFTGEASRIQVLDRNFQYIATTPPQMSEPMPGAGLAVTINHVYTGCTRSESYRVCPRNASPPFEEQAPFLPSLDIVSPPMSSIAFGATPNGQYVIVAFMGLPYLLVYNADHEHIHTVRLVGEPINDHANNYTMSRPGVPGTGLRILILRVHVLNDEYMAIPLRDTWHFIRFARGGTFMHVGAARLMRSGQPDARAVMATSQAQLHGEHLYVYANDVPHLLRYSFPF